MRCTHMVRRYGIKYVNSTDSRTHMEKNGFNVVGRALTTHAQNERSTTTANAVAAAKLKVGSCPVR